MTTTTDQQLPAGVVELPQGDRPLLDDLGIRELRIGNAELRGDCVAAITTPTADRWDALAIVGWLWHKRQDPGAQLAAWTSCTAGQLSWALGLDGRNVPDDVDDQVDDVAAPAPWTDDVAATVAADPTAPRP